MMRLYFLGGLFGGAFARSSSSGSTNPSTGHCASADSSAAAVISSAQKKSQDKALDPSIRCVIVGGGYAGCELAYKLDSVFDVTLIDEKNFLENRMEMVKVLCSPWNEGGGAAGEVKEEKDDASVSSSKRLATAAHFVHRVYLKRANVVTGTVEHVQFDPPRGKGKEQQPVAKAALMLGRANQQQKQQQQQPSSSLTAANTKFVRLADGRTVPFDLIIFATGEQLAFPFTTKQQTSDKRLAEVKNFCDFMKHCHKVAVVGGGPLGCSVAGYLASGRPDMMIDLYNKHSTLLEKLPRNMRTFALQGLEQFPNLKIHHCATVEDVAPRVVSLEGGSSSSSTAKAKSVALETALGKMQQVEDERKKKMKKDDNSAAAAEQVEATDDAPYDISYDVTVRKFATPPTVTNPSIFVRCWMGEDFRGEMPLLPEHLPIKGKSAAAAAATDKTDDKDNSSNSIEDASLTPAAALAKKRRQLEAERRQKSTIETIKGYDYVFVCTGGVPRTDLCVNSPELRGQVDARGHIRISKFFQLYGYPEAWAVGRCTALPFTRSVGQSNLASNTLFRALMARFSESAGQTSNGGMNTQLTSKMALDAHCVMPQRMAVPRIVVPLGPSTTTACGAWYGPVGGDSANKEKKVEEQMFREFRNPKFFKVQDPRKVRQSYEKWLPTASTPVVDFTGLADV